jgi:hypothetical protein
MRTGTERLVSWEQESGTDPDFREVRPQAPGDAPTTIDRDADFN